MKTYPFLLAVTLLSLSFCAQKQVTSPDTTPPTTGGSNTVTDTAKKLVWYDEFNGTGLPDPSKWTAEVGGGGWGNNELQYYTKDSLSNARQENGNLVITLKKQSMGNNNYTSARLITRDKATWTYGRFEIRAKLPKGLGTWPAIWMLSANSPLVWPDDGEIDIMEHVGYDPGIVHATVHTKSYNHVLGTQKGATTTVSDFSDNFHIYKLEWTNNKMTFYVDDTSYFVFADNGSGYAAWPFYRPFFMILNIAYGGNWGGLQGVDDSKLPQQMLVDYVRVYQ
jgi:beta-glucanase (GH16 family)